MASLRPHPGNPRKITPARLEQLGRTLEAERGMLAARPLIALPDGTVIAGNQRLAAARALGWESIPVVYADLDEETAQRWMLLDNRPAGEDDVEALAAMLRELDAGQADLAGYAAEDVDAILRAAQPLSPRDPDDAPPLPQEARSVRGCVYELGPHRVMCGDSTVAHQVASLVADAVVSLVLADPPYGVDYHGGTMNAAQRSHRGEGSGQQRGRRHDAYADQFADYRGFLADALRSAYASSAARAPLMLWHSTSQLRAVLGALDDARWVNRSFIVWDKQTLKGGIGQAGKQYRSRFEPLLHCHKRGKTPWWFGPGNESDIWEVPAPTANPLHPTMKPVALYERQLRNHSRVGDVVLELFGGSGTTLVAAEMTGRVAYLVEHEPRFCDVIRQRYADYTGNPSLAP